MDDVDHSKPALPVVPDKCGPPTISLNYLLDFAIQQIYHEITVLSELLPKKLDGDRKISLVQFAHSTRMLFVKLLAVVKWVKSSKKFESCAAICYLLDQQSQYFIETADRLVTISREELVMARLPAFQVTAAVDVLTQGTYLHLPTIIQERFTLKPKIAPIDEANVLLRLNQVLQYRISKVASTLSPRIKGIVIKNGMLILTVPGEFEVNLTVLGEREQTPWTLLNIKMLVEDYEIGYGAQLVHPLQLHMLHTVLQSRMDVAKNPINEVYNFLHTFAQSLQLDVLFCQASQLAAGRLRRLSIDRLLSETLVVRCRERLLRIRKRLKAAKPLSIVLYAEFLPGSASELKELEISLYDGQSIDLLRKRIDRLKILLMIERYRRSVATLQVRIINENQMAPFFKKVPASFDLPLYDKCKVHSLPADRICLQFIKEEHFYLVVTFVSNENLTVKMSLYLLCTLDDKVQMMELNKEKQLISAPIDGVVDIEAKTFGLSENDDVWTQSVKTGVWVHEQTGISVGGPVDTIATSIIERLTRYSHIYETVNRFAKAYDVHYNKLCSVQAYTFHKLVIAYGRERDQQLIVSFRPRNTTNDRFNLNFGQFHLMPINEVTLRLTYGHIHLEFIMLSGDSVAIRDSSRDKPRCAGLHQFFHLLSNGTSKSCKESESRFARTSSPAQPASLPPNVVDASPAGLSLSASLSVPPTSDASAVSPATFGAAAELETSSAPVVIDHETLRRAFLFTKFRKNSPPPSDVAILERYFEQVVSRLNNELAVFSFINLCRMVVNGAISGIAQVMNAQMDPSPSTYWNVSIQLVCLTRDQTNTSVRRYQIGTVFDANNVNVLLLVGRMIVAYVN
ncbi:mediator complex subunit MED14 [Ancylostoma ceylanicum]|uniref:Mediator of RNA polymerase II transcription subunit 14 n=1 Tax=Ancylostoma ceylanicum TaxID=53326 RepID=A0A0D6L7Z8_9BILA|nr:mediator complex subunit MED14 [Ancylostoma ceylanicum]